MAAVTWNGVSGDWTDAADWSGGAVPGAGDSATLGGAGAYTVTLYATAPVAALTMAAPAALFYDAGLLALGGVFALQAGTFALAYGALQGGTLALAGGTLLAEGGTLEGVAVQGSLSLSQGEATLVVQGGLAMSGAGGSGAGTVAVTGSYAALDFVGSQSVSEALLTLGSTGAGPDQGGAASMSIGHAYGATSGATLTLAANCWTLETGAQGQIVAGAGLAGPVVDEVLNRGLITDGTAGSTLTLGGPGLFDNAGTMGISNGATLDIAAGSFTNTGTIVVSAATLELGGTFGASRLGALGPLSLSDATVAIGGDALNAGGTLAVGAATPLGAILLAGTITGGAVADSGGGLNLSAGTGVLDGVAYAGSLALGQGDALVLADGTTLSDAGGAGTVSLSGAGAALLLEGLNAPGTELNNATISLGSSSGTAALGTADSWLAGSATTATLGAGLVIQQTGKFAAIDANATTPIAGYGLADTLVNQGSITAGFAGGTLTLGGAGSFINQGSIAVSNGDTLVMDAMAFSNTGTIAISGGATAMLGGPADVFGQVPAWSNTGEIALSGGTLVLSGTAQTGQIGHVAAAGGTVVLAGILRNAGATLSLGAGAMLPGLSLTGTIIGGAIADPHGLLTLGTGGAALLDGVTDTGTLSLNQAGAWLRVRDGLTLNGEALVTGAGAVLGFEGDETFNTAQIVLGAGGSAATLDVLHDGSLAGGSTLSLGASVSITQGGALADIGAATDLAGDGISSAAMITAAVAGGTFTLGGADFTNRGAIRVSNGDTLMLAAAGFSDTGTITLTGATLAIADSVTASALGSLVLSNAAVAVSGTLTETGGTLSIGAGSAWGRLSLTGTIAGGVIQDGGLGLAAQGGATLAGVTYEGALNLSRPFQHLTLEDGITLTGAGGSGAGTILLTGAASAALAEGSQTISDTGITLGSAAQIYDGQHVAPPEFAAGPATTLTLAAGDTVRAAGLVGWLGDYTVGDWTDAIVNDGLILAASPGGLLTLGSSLFVNAGGLVIGDGGNAMVAGEELVNSGGISVTAGSALTLSLYAYYAAPNAGATVFSNGGTLKLLGGVVQELTGGGLFPAVPVVNAAGGMITGIGNILAPVVNDGTIEAQYGPNLTVDGAITGTGLLLAQPGTVLELGGTVASSQTVRFTAAGETVRLDDAQGFAAEVTGFTGGDHVDVTGTPIGSVAISAGTLVLGTGYGQFRLETQQPVAGAISVGADAHGGALVTYLQQSAGGLVVAVTQARMLFWAGTPGDVFTGASAALQGADIANWASVDSLDFTDMTAAAAHVSYAQGSGTGTLSVSDGSHSDTLVLVGSFTPAWFHVAADGHGGALVTYSQS